MNEQSRSSSSRTGTQLDGAAGTTGAPGDPLIGDPLIGLSIGKYVVEKKLGEGGMGAVYRMRHVEIPSTWLALKVLTLRGAPGDEVAMREMADRFLQEARAASAVGSHRVVQVVDVGQFDDGTRYLMMEYVPGRSIGQAIEQDGPMDVRKALLVCARVADTLAIAHQRGIIHRDIKPMNLMLVDEGDDPVVKILDFGVSRATGEAKIAHTTERRIIGSPGYMAPEAAIGTPVDGRADVFSLAATLFEMLTGQLAFQGTTFHALMMATIQDPIPPASTLRPAHLGAVPDAVEAVLAWGLTKDPAHRPPMAEFRAALVEAAEAMAATRRGTGPVLASVMRGFTPSPAERPTLSAGAAEASEILARYGTPPPGRVSASRARGTPAPSGMGAAGGMQPAGSDEEAIPSPVSDRQSVSRPGPGYTPPAEAAARGQERGSSGNRTLLIAGGVALVVVTALATALLWPRSPAPSRDPVVTPAPAPRPVEPAPRPAEVAPAPTPPAPPPAPPNVAEEPAAAAPDGTEPKKGQSGSSHKPKSGKGAKGDPSNLRPY